MSKEMFTAYNDNDTVEEWARTAVRATVVIAALIFCAGIVVGCLIASVLP